MTSAILWEEIVWHSDQLSQSDNYKQGGHILYISTFALLNMYIPKLLDSESWSMVRNIESWSSYRDESISSSCTVDYPAPLGRGAPQSIPDHLKSSRFCSETEFDVSATSWMFDNLISIISLLHNGSEGQFFSVQSGWLFHELVKLYTILLILDRKRNCSTYLWTSPSMLSTPWSFIDWNV